MSIAYGAPCEKCGSKCRLRLDSDGNGNLVETLIEGCEHERKRRGVCKTCRKPVVGKIGRSVYCEPCRRAARKAAVVRWQKANPEQYRAIQKATYEKDPEAHRQRKREYRQRPEVKERNREAMRRRSQVSHPRYEAAQARRRERYHRNAEAERARRRAAYHADPEKSRQASREAYEFRKRVQQRRAA